MGRRSVEPGTLRFVCIAIVLMLLTDQFIFGGKRSYIEDLRTHPVEQAQKAPPVRVEPPDGKEYFEAPLPLPLPEEPVATVPEPAEMMEKSKAPDTPLVPKDEKDKKQGMKAFVPHGAPKVAIIIDDLGMDIKHSREIMDLPAPITLAFLPYAPKTKELAAQGKAKGHSLIIHVPMEAMDSSVNIGPGGLKSGMDDAAFTSAFGTMLASFDGYEGINNHMGSRLTQDEDAMDRVMKALAEKGLFFVDSKTSPKSVGAIEASEGGVPYAQRDVFLDHVDSASSVMTALKHTEELAKRRGYAIAIGHPKANTIAGLKAWLPTLKEKGIELVPVKNLLVMPEKKNDAVVPVVVGPPPDMFPEESPTGVTTIIDSSEPEQSGPEIQLHPLPEQSPAP